MQGMLIWVFPFLSKPLCPKRIEGPPAHCANGITSYLVSRATARRTQSTHLCVASATSRVDVRPTNACDFSFPRSSHKLHTPMFQRGQPNLLRMVNAKVPRANTSLNHGTATLSLTTTTQPNVASHTFMPSENFQTIGSHIDRVFSNTRATVCAFMWWSLSWREVPDITCKIRGNPLSVSVALGTRFRCSSTSDFLDAPRALSQLMVSSHAG